MSQDKQNLKKVGRTFGFLFSYFLSVTVIYFVFSFINRTKANYVIIMIVVLFVSALGYSVKKCLK
ncbi:hypothetical protein J4438_01170 [Candidatus Woesearchaeota archaeon]|nr:hypothetical protein [Candidatus Woesearchaeota archaeon]